MTKIHLQDKVGNQIDTPRHQLKPSNKMINIGKDEVGMLLIAMTDQHHIFKYDGNAQATEKSSKLIERLKAHRDTLSPTELCNW